MKKNKVKKENPPARLLWTMFLLVLGMVIVYGTLVLGIFALVQRLVDAPGGPVHIPHQHGG